MQWITKVLHLELVHTGEQMKNSSLKTAPTNTSTQKKFLAFGFEPTCKKRVKKLHHQLNFSDLEFVFEREFEHFLKSASEGIVKIILVPEYLSMSMRDSIIKVCKKYEVKYINMKGIFC